MADLNSITILGNVGKDAELKFTSGGTATAAFSVATNRSRPNGQGGWDKETEWFNVVMWGKTAETFAEKIKKGDRVLVIGRMQTRSWEKDGQKQYRTELVADRVLPQGTPMRASPVRAINDSEIEEDFEGFE